MVLYMAFNGELTVSQRKKFMDNYTAIICFMGNHPLTENYSIYGTTMYNFGRRR